MAKTPKELADEMAKGFLAKYTRLPADGPAQRALSAAFLRFRAAVGPELTEAGGSAPAFTNAISPDADGTPIPRGVRPA
jgi:hypothetical protein